MRYRQATGRDVSAIAALHAESWRFAYRGALSDAYLGGPIVEDRMGVWQERLSAPPSNQHVIVAEEERQMVGFACAFGNRDERWGTLLDNLHVRREWQGKGIGRDLVAEVAKWCAVSYPDSGLYLSVLEQNSRARGFYESLGGTAEDGAVWNTPGGGNTLTRRYVWPKEALEGLAVRQSGRIARNDS